MSSEPLRPELILLVGLLALVAGFVAVILVVSLATAVL